MEDSGFPVEIRFHHARALGDIDSRGLCGCGVGHCTFQAGKDLRLGSRWQQEQHQARRDWRAGGTEVGTEECGMEKRMKGVSA